MTKYRIIGNMTGNSMDAIDLVMTEFAGDKMTDVCAYSKSYDKVMQEEMETLRKKAFNKTKEEIEALPEFQKVHDGYVQGIADCINEMCVENGIDKKTVAAIGFHGKTLDHNPPSKARIEGTKPYTLQIGSGQMLADLTGIPVVYDFRSDYIMQGFEGAPLVAPHNAHLASIEGDGIYFNGGNTSNFAIIRQGQAVISSDAGPFNEYTDNFIRLHTKEAFDKEGMFGKKGQVKENLLQKIFDCGRDFYQTALPKSGDPAYYHKKEIFQYVQDAGISIVDAVRTFEYAAAYMAVYALSLVPEDVLLPENIVLFGGGWKNPIVREAFADLLNGRGMILAEHSKRLAKTTKRFIRSPILKYSAFGEYMEARLMADLAHYKLENRVWEIPEIVQSGKKIVSGVIALPNKKQQRYADCICRAAKGW